jgi:hypothetical protein
VVLGDGELFVPPATRTQTPHSFSIQGVSEEYNRPSIVDVDGDGYRDLVLVGAVDGVAELVIFFNRGDDRLDPDDVCRVRADGEALAAFTFANLDDDDDPELVVATASQLWRLERQQLVGTIAIEQGQRLDVGTGVSLQIDGGLVGGDFDGDGVDDIALGDFELGFAVFRGGSVR